jgi:hypothetical protein
MEEGMVKKARSNESRYRLPRRQLLPALSLVIAVLLGSCASMETAFPDQRRPPKSVKPDSLPEGARTVQRGERNLVIADGYVIPTRIQEMIVTSGIRLTETGSLVVNGQEFPADCTGTVLAAYWGAGLNPVKYFHLYDGNGVKRLNDMGEAYDLSYLDAMPSPGDVIIWDNTYDKDGDGKWGDPFTHAGIVTSVTDTGQITYLHYNYARGVVLEKMNLLKPDEYTDAEGNLVNSPLRLRADRHIRPDAWLASHLVRGFIPLYEYPGLEE